MAVETFRRSARWPELNFESYIFSIFFCSCFFLLIIIIFLPKVSHINNITAVTTVTSVYCYLCHYCYYCHFSHYCSTTQYCPSCQFHFKLNILHVGTFSVHPVTGGNSTPRVGPTRYFKRFFWLLPRPFRICQSLKYWMRESGVSGIQWALLNLNLKFNLIQR